jgi:hypothetical protein
LPDVCNGCIFEDKVCCLVLVAFLFYCATFVILIFFDTLHYDLIFQLTYQKYTYKNNKWEKIEFTYNHERQWHLKLTVLSLKSNEKNTPAKHIHCIYFRIVISPFLSTKLKLKFIKILWRSKSWKQKNSLRKWYKSVFDRSN